MQKYNKAIIAVVGAVAVFMSVYFNSSDWLTMIVPVLTALGVYQIENKR